MSMVAIIGPWTVVGGFFVLIIVALELGYLLGRRQRKGAADTKSDGIVTMVNGVVLTSFGLLLAFTFSMAFSRSEERRQLLVQEANAIGTAYPRTKFLDEPIGSKMRDLLRQYTKVRIKHNESFYYDPEYKQTLLETERLQGELWSLITAEIRKAQFPLVPVQVVTPLNQMIDSSAAVYAAQLNKVPVTVLLLILATFLSSLLIGHSFGRRQRRLPVWVVFPYDYICRQTILDLDQPRWGLIRVEQPAIPEFDEEHGAGFIIEAERFVTEKY